MRLCHGTLSHQPRRSVVDHDQAPCQRLSLPQEPARVSAMMPALGKRMQTDTAVVSGTEHPDFFEKNQLESKRRGTKLGEGGKIIRINLRGRVTCGPKRVSGDCKKVMPEVGFVFVPLVANKS